MNGEARQQLGGNKALACSLFLRASSFILAFSSSFLISSRFVSKLICTRNISRFLAINSAMLSFSCCLSLVINVAAWCKIGGGRMIFGWMALQCIPLVRVYNFVNSKLPRTHASIRQLLVCSSGSNTLTYQHF